MSAIGFKMEIIFKSTTISFVMMVYRQLKEEIMTLPVKTNNETLPADTHSKTVGYLLWVFGFTGSHRFYYGKQVSGTLYFFTFGLLLIGWLVDLFLIPSMDEEADQQFTPGPINYSIAWLLLTFLGVFGVHRFYIGKWGTGIIYLLTGGLLLVGVIYDFWNLNNQISEIHTEG